jgi:hypothetical protein
VVGYPEVIQIGRCGSVPISRLLGDHFKLMPPPEFHIFPRFQWQAGIISPDFSRENIATLSRVWLRD